MENSSKLFEALWSLVVQLPSLLTVIACIVAAIIRWKRHPRISLAIVIGLSLIIVHTFIFAFVYAFVPELFARPGNYSMVLTVITVISFIYNSSLAIALGVMLTAVFMGRSAPASLPGANETLA